MTEWSRAKPLRSGEAWTRRQGSETAVYMDGVLHMLNASALAIWELCDGETTADEMAEAVAEVAGLEIDLARADVEVALRELHERSLISTGEEAAP